MPEWQATGRVADSHICPTCCEIPLLQAVTQAAGQACRTLQCKKGRQPARGKCRTQLGKRFATHLLVLLCRQRGLGRRQALLEHRERILPCCSCVCARLALHLDLVAHHARTSGQLQQLEWAAWGAVHMSACFLHVMLHCKQETHLRSTFMLRSNGLQPVQGKKRGSDQQAGSHLHLLGCVQRGLGLRQAFLQLESRSFGCRCICARLPVVDSLVAHHARTSGQL